MENGTHDAHNINFTQTEAVYFYINQTNTVLFYEEVFHHFKSIVHVS